MVLSQAVTTVWEASECLTVYRGRCVTETHSGRSIGLPVAGSNNRRPQRLQVCHKIGYVVWLGRPGDRDEGAVAWWGR